MNIRDKLNRLGAMSVHPAAVVVATILFVIMIRRLENTWLYVPFIAAVTLLVAGFVFGLSRRIAFSIYTAQMLLILQSLASIVKFRLKGLAFHAYDIFFTGTDSSAVMLLLGLYKSLFIGAAVVLISATVVLYWIYRIETPVNWRFRRRSMVLGVAAAMTYALYPTFGKDKSSYSPFIEGNDVSAFPISVGQLRYPFSQIALAEKLGAVNESGTLPGAIECDGDRRKPDVVMVLTESQTTPDLFKKIALPKEFVESYRSGDGKLHDLYVETFGGGTWQTNFTMMTGLSTADFGWQAPYVTQIMEGRVKDSFPQTLAACGYHTVTMMPTEFNFVNEGNFHKSIGIDDVHDAARMGLTDHRPRDTSYFDYANKLIAEHRKTDPRPLFLAIQTMYTHSPYSGDIPGDRQEFRGLTDDPQLNEYLARVATARADLTAFREGLAKAPGERGTLFLEFGDHQSIASRSIVEAQEIRPNPYAHFRSSLYRTYFAVHGFGTPVDFSKFGSQDDAGYLLARLSDAAKLPMSPTALDLLRLADLCKGRLHLCEMRAEIDQHLKRRVNSGMLNIQLTTTTEEASANVKKATGH